MYARVTLAQLQPGKIQEHLNIGRDRFAHPGPGFTWPEQYSIQTLIGIRRGDGWHFTFFQNTLIQQERSS